MLKRLGNLSIRTKLTWLVMALMIVPWMGYHYTQEMQRFLIQGQQNAMLLSASGIATVLNDRADLFSETTGVPEVLGKRNNIYAHQLSHPIQLDGLIQDWNEVEEFSTLSTGNVPFSCNADYNPDSFSLRNIVAYHQLYVYVLFDVIDDQIIYRDLDRLSLDASDHLRILIQRPDNSQLFFLAVARAQGRMSIYRVDEEWRLPIQGDPLTTLTAEMAETNNGYRIELRIPRFMLGLNSKIGFFSMDVDDEESREIVGTLSASPQTNNDELGTIFLESPQLTKILKGLDQPKSRIWILDQSQRVRAVIGGLSTPKLDAEDNLEEPENIWVYAQAQKLKGHLDALLKRPIGEFEDLPTDTTHRPEKMFSTIFEGEPLVESRPSVDNKAEIIVAGYPIKNGDDILGAVVIEQSSHVVLSLQYRMLRSLTVVTILVYGFVILALLIFAWRLTSRIRKLHNTTEKAITTEGRVLEERIPDRQYSLDELGDLGRSISSMLTRLSGYTRYLEGMPDTLAHEMKNPLNVVSSSLEILESDVPSTENNKYMLRARNGVNRLRSILTNLTEAANLEEAMRGEVKEKINLTELLPEIVEGYRSSQTGYQFELQSSSEEILIEGSEDHLAQLLDKLIDNAVEFCLNDTVIQIILAKTSDHASISVMNQGPYLPQKLGDRLFDPMVSMGKRNAKQSHLGLGLFVVRLITEYHQGTVSATNRTDTRGVIVTVSLPLLADSQI